MLEEKRMEQQYEAVRAALKARRTPASLEELMVETGLKKPALTAMLDALHAAGEVMCTRRQKYAVPKAVGCVAGRIQGTRKGYAFLIPFDGSPDVFIGQDDLMGAMHDDEVIAKLMGRPAHGGGRKRQATGEVIEVLRRARQSVVGKLERSSHAAFLVPEDRRIPDLFIPQAELNGGQSGQLVVARILSYAQDGRNATGSVTEILGEAGTAQADVRGIIRHYGLRDAFESQTLLEAASVPQTVPEQESGKKYREDFRAWQTITIDGADAKDFDDAISLVETQGGYELGVHIADVSHYVRPGSALDTEAYRRGTSVYFPGMVLPMLPEALSNGICSLNAGEDRLTLSCIMQVDIRGVVYDYRFARGVIRVQKRVTYEDANAILEEGDAQMAQRYGEVTPLLRRMEKLARTCMQRRHARGSLDFDLAEPAFTLDESGRAIDVHPHHRGIANQMIEEFMLAANECAAHFARERELPFLYRVHENPDPGRIEDLGVLLKALGLPVPRPARGGRVQPRELQAVLQKAKGQPYEMAVSQVMLRSLKKARYCEEPMGHFGLAARDYCHFTSPIRRYPDLVVHRAIIAAISGGLSEKALERWHGEMPPMAHHTSECERIAMEAERAVDDLKCCEFMEDKVGQAFSGVISGVSEFALFVELPSTVEGAIRLSSLEDDYYIFDEKLYRIVGRNSGMVYALGDPIEVRVAGVDLGQRRVEFLLKDAPDPYDAPQKRRRHGRQK